MASILEQVDRDGWVLLSITHSIIMECRETVNGGNLRRKSFCNFK